MFMDSSNIKVQNQNILCPFCKEEIKQDAIICKHCNSNLKSKSKDGSLWVSILSVILGIVSILALFDDSEWDKDTYIGLFTFSISGLFLGILAITQKLNGKNIAILGILLSSLTLLLIIGVLLE